VPTCGRIDDDIGVSTVAVTTRKASDLPNSPAAQFSRDLEALNSKPLWERKMKMVPGSPAVPTIWHYRDMRPQLMRAVEVVSTEEAERRVLMLENPGLPGTTYITSSVYSGLQIIMPGEVASAHRHSTNAMRFIMEGSGAYSTVNGERVMMEPGDFVLTPAWHWHDHGHLGSEPVIWLDALDNPFAQMFGAIFREYSDVKSLPVTHVENESGLRYGAHILPVEQTAKGLSSPMMIYPYDRTREALFKLARVGPVHPAYGVKVRYANPATGGYPFPTIGVFIEWLPAGFKGVPYRATDGTVFCAVEGRGRMIAGDKVMAFEKNDVFVAPPWVTYRLESEGECVLFCYSDRAAQDALGYWREEFPVAEAAE
jgi:gentisate 1,2-dioxygenase